MITTNTFKLVTLEQLKENREYLNMGGVRPCGWNL
jgi:hypothetical protein